MSETIEIPEGYTLLRAVDYSDLQDIAGPARAWAEADAALQAHEANHPPPDGRSYTDRAARWFEARKPLAARERETRKSMLAAARASLVAPPQ